MAFSDPQKIMESVGITEGTSVADLGSGTGFYTMAAARAVGGGGKVFAVDIQQDLLARLRTAAHAAKLHNIEYLHGDVERVGGTRIREASIDLVIAANIMFQLDHKDGFVDEVKRILKPNGRVLVVDWSDSFGGAGPQSETLFIQQMAKELFEKKGFSFVTGVVAGDHHYGLIFRKS